LASPRVLFVSGSVGLGHVMRDLGVAGQLRRRRPDVQLAWLAAGAARDVLQRAGEDVLPEAVAYGDYLDDQALASSGGRPFSANVLRVAMTARHTWRANTHLLASLLSNATFDLLIGDETYELSLLLAAHPELRGCPYVMLCDFFGVEAVAWRPAERYACRRFNRLWIAADRRLFSTRRDRCLFVGEPEDVPDARLGLGLPNRRRHALKHYDFVGYVLPFEPAAYADRASVRARLGYDGRPLIVASTGGTALGGDLLQLCADAYPFIRRRLPDVRLVLVCGPRIARASLAVSEDVAVRGFVPDLFAHLAASDLAIVQAGGTTTLELTALRRPFLYFPLEGHFEQALVAARLARHGAGVRLRFSETSPRRLAEKVLAHLGEQVHYALPPVDGADKAARLILSLIGSHGDELPAVSTTRR
jgi:UDP:flavonoid glycosyltransferase YjiC (YdhE family)